MAQRNDIVIRAWATATALLAIMAMAACAGVHADQVAATTAEEQLRVLDQELVDAEVRHDRKALERILDDGFVATFTSGKTYDKAAYTEAILSRPIAPFDVVHDLVRVYDDTAIVVDRIGPGLQTKVIWVAIRREGKWRVIAEQFLAIAPAPK